MALTPHAFWRGMSSAFLLLMFTVAELRADDVRSFELEPGEASETLKLFARQAGVSIVFDVLELRGVRTREVKGRLSTSVALERVLSGTPLVFNRDPASGAIAIIKAEPASASRSDPTSAPEPAMNPSRSAPAPASPEQERMTRLPRFVRSLIAIALANYAQAQPAGENDTPITLSPFTVDATQDRGYATQSTLSGTRIRTNLEDVATTIQVVNRQFFEDTGSTSAKDLLVYTTGTEVTGPGGNFTDARSTGAQTPLANFESNLNANAGSRVRGLLSADNTRDFFTTGVPFDSYNLERIEINRGANAALFGIGSPAGIINSTTIRPRFRTGGDFTAGGGSFGSFRATADWEQQLLEGSLSLRLAGMVDNEKYEQAFAFEDDERLFGALAWRPAFLRKGRFVSDVVLRVNGERGRIDANRPRVNAPYTNVPRWFELGRAVNDPRFANLRAVDRNVFDLDILRSPNVFFADPNSSRPGGSGNGTILGTVGVANLTTGIPGGNGFVPSFGGNPPVFGGGPPIFAFYAAPADYQLNVAGRNPFSNGVQILDEAIFPYRDYLYDGPNKEEHFKFTSFSADAEILFLNNTAGIEVSYFREDATEWGLNGIRNSDNSGIVNIDNNSHLLNGEPNPNFGRPYLVAKGSSRLIELERDSFRTTAFYQRDFTRLIEGWVGKVLGRHTWTLNYSTNTRNSMVQGGNDYVAGPELRAIPGNRTRSDQIDDLINRYYYLGPSVLGLSRAEDLRLSPVTAVMDPSTVTPGDGGFILWDNELKQWVTPFVSIIKNLSEDGIPFAANANRGRTKVDSSVLVWQSHLLSDALVGTLSWRKDQFESFINAPVVRGSRNEVLTDPANFRLTAEPSLETEDNTFAYGVVGKVPSRWLRVIPSVSRLSFFYNDSQNFEPTGVRVNAYGETVGPPTGTTEDFGFALGMFDDRLSLRTTWYKTSQANNAIGGEANSIISLVGSLWTDAITRINRNGGTLRAGDLFLSPGITQTQVDQQVAAIRANPFPLAGLYQHMTDNQGVASQTVPQGMTETSDLVSEGLEVELTWNPTRNWRLTANVAKQRAVRSNSVQVISRLVEQVRPLVSQFRDLPTFDTFSNNVGRVYDTQILAPLERLKSLDGESSPEVREWRVNVISNYTFPSDSALRGWNVGGAVRWQDAPVIGSSTFLDATTGVWRIDPGKTFYGDSETRLDAWVGYQRTLDQGRVLWRTQLNIRNLLNNDDLIPVRANPETGTPEIFSIPQPITFMLTTKFSF